MLDQEICINCLKLKDNIDYKFMKKYDLVDEWICKDCSQKLNKKTLEDLIR